MTSLAQRLHAATAIVAPIVGVSIGRRADRLTWRIDFASDATEAQRNAVAAVIAVFDPDAPFVPASVTPYQARRALNAAGLRDAAEAAVAAASYEVRDAWDYALTIERNSPFIATMAAALNLTDAEVDALFIAAAAY